MTEALLKLAEGLDWQDIETAPRDGTPVILDVGLPWSVVGVWSEALEVWCYSQLQVSLYNDKWDDCYFENEWDKEIRIKGWMPLPTGNTGEIIRVLVEGLDKVNLLCIDAATEGNINQVRNDIKCALRVIKNTTQKANQLAGGE